MGSSVFSDALTPDQALEGHAQRPEGAAEVAQTAFLDLVQDAFMVATIAVESHRALDVFSRLSNATPDTFETLKKDARLHYLTGYRSD